MARRTEDVAVKDRVTLGIDPGIATTGYAVLVGDRLRAAGKITTSSREPEPARLAVIFQDLLAIMQEYRVEDVALEKFIAFYTSEETSSEKSLASRCKGTRRGSAGKRKGQYDGPANPDSIYKMKGAQATVQLAAMVHGATLFEYTLSEWKGDARRKKDEIRAQVQLLYGVEIRNHNISDAVMIARHHATRGHLLRSRGVHSPIALPVPTI